MNIHEHQAKDLLRKYGVATSGGGAAFSPEEAEKIAATIPTEVKVVKAQIHAGGRGKGHFKEKEAGEKGGVRFAKSPAEARALAEQMLNHTLVTIQTGEEGKQVNTVFVEQGLDIARELYLGIVVDRDAKGPVLIMSTEGGMEIEEVAAHTPEKILKEAFDVDLGLSPFQARKLAFKLGLEGTQIRSAEKFLTAVCKFFVKHDCSMAEINPLVVTKQGELVALDAKVSFDDNAAFRHEAHKPLRDLSEENAAEVEAAATGLSFVKLEGNIGCLVNGAGLAMSTMDLIKLHGGQPANFLDVGGGANVDQVTQAFKILLADKNVKAVLVNIFGGIMKCDTIVEALLVAYEKVGFNVPLVVRLEGTNVEIARDMLAKSGRAIISANGLTDAAQKVVATLKA